MNKFGAHSKSPTSTSKETGKDIDGDVDHGKEVIGEKCVKKPRVELETIIETIESKKDVASSLGKKSREVKCFKCQGYGHIASQCHNKRVMIITGEGVIAEEEDKHDQDPAELLTTMDAYYVDKEANTFENLGQD